MFKLSEIMAWFQEKQAQFSCRKVASNWERYEELEVGEFNNQIQIGGIIYKLISDFLSSGPSFSKGG